MHVTTGRSGRAMASSVETFPIALTRFLRNTHDMAIIIGAVEIVP